MMMKRRKVLKNSNQIRYTISNKNNSHSYLSHLNSSRIFTQILLKNSKTIIEIRLITVLMLMNIWVKLIVLCKKDLSKIIKI